MVRATVWSVFSARGLVVVAMSLTALLVFAAPVAGDGRRLGRDPELRAPQPFVIDSGAIETLEPRYGGVIHQAVTALPATFNPFRSVSAPDNLFFDNVLPTLVTLDRATLELVPFAAAEIVPVVPNQVFEFTIRQGIRWSDFPASRRVLGSDDVMLSAQLHADPAVGSIRRPLFFVSGQPVLWQKLDERVVRMTLPSPSAIPLTHANFRLVPAHIFGPLYQSGGAGAVRAAWSTATPPSELVGTGPFSVSAFDPALMVLERRDDTWFVDARRRKVPFVDGISFNLVSSAGAARQALIEGSSDFFTTTVGATSLISLVQAGQLDARPVDLGPSPIATFFTTNWNHVDLNKRKLFRTRDFRRALSHLTDRDRIVGDVFEGRALPLFGPVSPAFPEFNRSVPRFAFDPAEGRALIEGLGFARDPTTGVYRDVVGSFGGMELAVTILTNAGNRERALSQERLAADLQANGFSVATQDQPFGAVASRLITRDFEIILIGLVSGRFEPVPRGAYGVPRTLPLWSNGNPFEPEEITLDALVQRQITDLDAVSRHGAIRDAQALVAQQQLLDFTVVPTPVEFVRNRLRNTAPAGLWSPFIQPSSPPYLWVAFFQRPGQVKFVIH